MSRHVLFAVGVVLLILAGITLLVQSDDPAIRPIGIGACFIGVYLIRTSTTRRRSALGAREVAFKTTQSPNRLLWVVSAALSPLSVIAFLYLENDAAHGYHQVLPVYVFAGVAIVCAVVWSSLVSKIL
jgi:hypothetical protein